MNLITRSSPIYRTTIFTAKRALSDSPTFPKVIALQPGLMLIKNGLSNAEQIELAKFAIQYGEVSENGFYKIDELGQRVLNQSPTAPHRGRIYLPIEKFPSLITELCLKNLFQASQIDPSIKVIEATHVILLYYKTLLEDPKESYIRWHQDKDPNDGDEDKPVVSFTLGDSCDFLVCKAKPQISTAHPLSDPANLSHRILFESGDVLIFGGTSRKIYHSIYKIHSHTAPKFLPLQNGRLNFTFRFTPKIKGDEEKYSSKNFKSVYDKKT